MEKASHGLEGREARFAIYRALCSQIFVSRIDVFCRFLFVCNVNEGLTVVGDCFQDVEQSMARAGPKSVLMYPPALLEYIRKIHGGEVAGGSGRGKMIVTLETIALMKWC